MWLREPPFPRLHARFLRVLLTQIYIYYIASNGPLTQLDDRTKFSHPPRMPESRDRRASVATVFRHLERWEGLRKWRLCSQTMYRHGNMPKCVRCLGIRAVCVCVGKGRVRTHTRTCKEVVLCEGARTFCADASYLNGKNKGSREQRQWYSKSRESGFPLILSDVYHTCKHPSYVPKLRSLTTIPFLFQ